MSREKKIDSVFDGFDPGLSAPKAPPPPGVRRLTVTWGDEYIQPIQFNGFHTGTLEIVVDVPEGGDATALYNQAFEFLAELGQQQFQRKCAAYLAHLKEAATATRNARATNQAG